MKISLFSALVISLSLTAISYAGSATWNLNPTNGDWNTAANWTPVTVPNQPADVATFATSNQTSVSFTTPGFTTISGVTFNSGASPFTIGVGPAGTGTVELELSGTGIVNNSGIIQNVFVNQTVGSETILDFQNSATAGDLMQYVIGSGEINFDDFSSAGTSTITMNGGFSFFRDSSTAAQATLILKGSDSAPAEMTFISSTTSAGSATFIVNGTGGGAGNVCGMGGNSSTAIFTANGAIDSAHGPGQVTFGSAGGAATVTANPGTNGGAGGLIFYNGSNDVNTDRMILVGATNGGSGSGTLDIESASVTIGSLEGNGLVKLGGFLTVGANNLSTKFSGVIEDASSFELGTLVKTGTGTLTLSGVSTYTAGTQINGGTLLVTNRTGSGTGANVVSVNSGTLGGTGIISNSVVVGTASTVGALAPGAGKKTGTLTVLTHLTFSARGKYVVDLNSTNARADQVSVAKGVTITRGATASIVDRGNALLAPGTGFTIINNIASSKISGSFNNLRDGSTLTVGSNTYLVSYSGGDGNDLTLTVQ